MRVACYARYSSDLQRETSIEDQLAVARRFSSERGWTVLDGHVYTDAGISGASIEGRAGLQALLSAAAQQPRPFDVVLVDDSSRIARDIADAIRVMQRLKFWGIRVLYLSQGIDSDSEQAESLVAVHGLVDSLYLRELAKKVRRGLAGQHTRGFATGAKTFGYDTVAVPDPSGRREPGGAPALLGKRIVINQAEADVVRRIFAWAADGVGVATIVERLNREGSRGPRGRRWGFSVVRRMLQNERYRGRHIWGQQKRERQPGTNHKVARLVPREQWHIHERPDLQIVSDAVWERVQAVRSEVRQSVAPKRNLARGRDARFHSPHLFSGFMKCGCCGGAITTVSGGKGSPRFGCSRSWRNGVSACPNRLTIRAKVAEPQLLAKLQRELLDRQTLSYVTRAVQTEIARASEGGPERASLVRDRLEDEKRKRQNLVTAIEGGADVASLLAALREREATIERLQGELAQLETQAENATLEPAEDLSEWVQEQLRDLHGLLKDAPERTKGEFRRLHLQVVLHPIEAEPRPYFRVEGQCDLSALAFSFWAQADRFAGAPVRRLRVSRARARNSSHARSTS
jgi:site-specific DNA recombinase